VRRIWHQGFTYTFSVNRACCTRQDTCARVITEYSTVLHADQSHVGHHCHAPGIKRSHLLGMVPPLLRDCLNHVPLSEFRSVSSISPDSCLSSACRLERRHGSSACCKQTMLSECLPTVAEPDDNKVSRCSILERPDALTSASDAMHRNIRQAIQSKPAELELRLRSEVSRIDPQAPTIRVSWSLTALWLITTRQIALAVTGSVENGQDGPEQGSVSKTMQQISFNLTLLTAG
jgi:hypothetical protein